ncbi:DUF4214 domain-containing protein [Sulfitobacter mediterraneus]|uniref:DUF4214 domain-containing protein n=1 Tax=Sulfitobacter mediterraneus TaxID=83219 RepID=UPI000EA199B3|nr:DUF4214 domain-containing protein [Sulfitobacter mediterraneus]
MSTSKELITELYIGYFDRAPDPEGLTFWIGVLEGGLSIEAIAQDFAGQAEAQATYDFLDTSGPDLPPSETEVEAFITAIYDNLFDRAPEPAGLTFWTGVLQDGYPVGEFILAIIGGASAADRVVLDNKIEVACAWADAAAAEDDFVLSADYINGSRDALGEVDADPVSVTAGKDAADLFFQEGPLVTLAGTTTTLSEDTDTAARVKVADIIITDDGVGTNVLTLTGEDAALFEIDGLELFLKAGTALDFETVADLAVTVTVDDAVFGDTPDDSVDLAITVTDVNEAPTVALANVLADISEDADTSAATKVADIVVSDDALGTNDLTLVGADAAFFEIVGTELFLKAGSVLDFETNATLDVNVEVDDAGVEGTPDDAAVLALPVTDANEAPAVTVTPIIATLAEDADTSSRIKVGDIAVTDDALGTNDLTLVGADAALFEIDGFELFLKAGSVLSFEGNPDLDVTVVVDDAGVGATPDDTDSMSVAVTDVNESPTVTLAGAVTTLAEDTDTAANVKVADILLSDDALGSNTLALTGADAGLFEISGSELFLKAGTVLDFETAASLDVSVTVDDASIGASPDDSADLTIAVTDVNEAPSVALGGTLTTLSETEDTAVRIKVADITISDDGLGTNSLAVTGEDAALFEIDGMELFLKAGTALDFESNPSLDVSVTVDDAGVGGNPDDTAALSIAVTDTNEAPSVALSGLPLGLPENTDTSTRVKVADIVITDDGLGTNSLGLAGSDAALFEIDGLELFLKASTALDFETNPALTVFLTIDDASIGSSFEDIATAIIPVTDVNEAPSVTLLNTTVDLSEDTSTATRIKMADIAVSDDATGTNVLNLTGDDAALFEIDGMELFLKAGVALDFETSSSLDVSVTVDDANVGDSPDSSAPLSVAITNVNEAPVVTLVGGLGELFEGTDTTLRVKVADIALDDDGTGSNLLGVAGADAALFEIDGTELFLKAGTALNASANPVLDVVVTVDDAALAGSPDDIDSLAITVTPGAAGAATDDTEELIFIGNAASVVRFGQIAVADADPDTPGDQPGFVFNTDLSDTPYAGVAGSSLSLIDTTAHDGLVSLGVIAEIDADDFTLDNTGSSGDVEGCLGTGNDGGVLATPSLGAAGTWIFDNTGATGDMELTLKALDVSTGFALVFNNVDIVVDGDVDLTGLGFGLDIDAASTVEVLDGATLTLTVQQVDQLQFDGVTIFGEGTVVVTGTSNDNDADLNTNFGNLATGTVDLSAVTLADDDTTDAVEIAVSGALDAGGSSLVDGDGVRVTQTVIGTAHNDAVTVGFSASDGDTGTIDVILELGADDGDIGDPLDTPEGAVDPAEVTGDTIDLDSTFSDVMINADAGFDAVTGVFGIPDGTVINVAVGAEFYAGVVTGDYIATAESSTDGTAVLEAVGVMDKTIDVSAAVGAAGWTLIGAAGSTETVLVGGDLPDILVDGIPDDVNNNNEEDTFTGNGGADTFVFNFATTTPATLADVENNPALDEEEITAVVGTNGGGESLIINYALGNTVGSLTVNDINYTNAGFVGDVDFSDTVSLAGAIADMMSEIAGITAVSDGVDTLTLTGDNGERMNVTSITPGGGAGASSTADAGTDTVQDNTVTITGTANAGELYGLTAQLSDGTDIEASFLATGGESATAIAAGLIADFNAAAGGAITAAAGGAGEINLTDANADDGGFQVTLLSATTSVGAASASSLLVGATTYAGADIDLITDFMDADGDLITFGLTAGTNSNYDEEVSQADFATAQGNADAAFAGDAGLIYFLSGSDADGVGLLFLNVDGDADADSVVALTGVNSTIFDEDNIA